MLDWLIGASIRARGLVVGLAVLLLVGGFLRLSQVPVDVFPDLNRPTVTVMTECPGMAPEEVERLVTFPLEAALNGGAGVERVRSVSAVGLSIVWVEFGWEVPQLVARQSVTERLRSATLPAGSEPKLAPISSIMGEVLLIGLVDPQSRRSPQELRTLADWQLRPRLLGVPGVSQVTVIGGEVRQYQVLADPRRLAAYGLSLEELTEMAGRASTGTPGGLLEQGGQELLVRNLGRVTSPEALSQGLARARSGPPVYLRDVARVVAGPRPKRGDASVNASPAVILTVQKQPGVDTVRLTAALLERLAEFRRDVPPGLEVVPLFQQSHFIEASVSNVQEALRDGAVLVALVLWAFLLSWRTTVITLTALPLSLATAGLILSQFGLSINTMTLGGLAIAIGELVDDAVVDVENVHRRLGQNAGLAHPKPPLVVVAEASREVRSSIVFATALIGLVFLPLFFLEGVEGRLFVPLGLAYVTALGASLLVSLSVTPALCALLLAGKVQPHRDSPLVRALKDFNRRLLEPALNHPRSVLAGALILVTLAVGSLAGTGVEFLPPFHEGTLTIELVGQPGLSLAESNRIGRAAEKLLLEVPEVARIGRRTGRAELDEHAEGVHYSELDVDLRPGRPQAQVLADIRRLFRDFPGVTVNLGQPISHRLDHMLSGIRAQVALKLFGPDLEVLRAKARELSARLDPLPFVVDLGVERQVLLPQLQVQLRPEAARRYGLSSGQLTQALEVALNGKTVGTILEPQPVVDLVVRLDERFRDRPEAIAGILIDTPAGKVPLKSVADVQMRSGPNQILRENASRRIVVYCNLQGIDLGTGVERIRQAVASVSLPPGYRLEFAGQFESQRSASRRLLGLGLLSLAGIAGLLYLHFRSLRRVAIVLAAIPMSIAGGALGVHLTGGTLSVASLVGFITLCGIASRNGIMRVSHYVHLLEHEGETFGRAMIVRGSLERMVPVLMTALTAGLGLLPLALAAGTPGKEILHPVAVVILTGLLTSTALDTLVTPVLFCLFGKERNDEKP